MSRSQTTSIKRPPKQAAADEGRSRLGDFTRPIPVDKRISRRPKVAMFAGLGVLAIVAVLGAAIFILPIGTWRGQDVDLTQRQAELDELQKVNGQLSAEVDRLQTDDGIREAAREEIGFVEQGERRSTILPLPPLPTDLPDGWPYSVVTGILAARQAGPAPTATETSEPATTEPATTEPVTTEPAAVEPAAVEPAAVEPATVEPATVEPATVEPATVDPATVDPATGEPAAVEPVPTEPVAPVAD